MQVVKLLPFYFFKEKGEVELCRKNVPKNNVFCLDEEHDEGEPDLHQCGHCKLMFNNLSKYITHKLQKVCWSENATAEEPAWSLDRNGSSSPEASTKEEADEEIEQLVGCINL